MEAPTQSTRFVLMPKTKIPAGPTCIRCHNPVVAIPGKQIARGRLPSHRHVGPPCGLGDPLFAEQVAGIVETPEGS